MTTTCPAEPAAALAHGRPRLPLPGLLALAAAAFTEVMTDLLPAGTLPQMSRSLHVPQARIGLLVSAFAVASALAAIPVTAAVRGLPRRPVLAGVLAGFAVLNAVTAVSSSYPLTFAARLLAGIMGGTLWSMLAGYAARMVPASNRGRATAIVLAGITAALSVGLPAGTALADMAGWRAGFALLSVTALLLMVWVRRAVPSFPGEARSSRAQRRVASQPGIRTVLAVTLVLLTGHQVLYTYIAPFAIRAGFGHTSLVLFVFGTATAGGIAVTGILADRHLRPVLLAALALIMTAMIALGYGARSPAVLLLAVALWGAAFGGAPALLQTALTDASGPGHADTATSKQTTVYNIGIAAGSLAGGLILQRGGAGALPWATSLLSAAALTIVAAARRHAFPADRGADAEGPRQLRIVRRDLARLLPFSAPCTPSNMHVLMHVQNIDSLGAGEQYYGKTVGLRPFGARVLRTGVTPGHAAGPRSPPRRGPAVRGAVCEWLFPADTLAEGRYDVSDAVALFARVSEQDFTAAQWCQPNMGSRAYRGGGVLVPSEAEVISQYYAWYRGLMGKMSPSRKGLNRCQQPGDPDEYAKAHLCRSVDRSE